MSFSVPTREIFLYRLVLSFCERSSEIHFSLLGCWYSLRLFDCCFACTSRQMSRVKMKSKCQNVIISPRMLIMNEGLLSTTHAYHEWKSSVHHTCLSRTKVFCSPRMLITNEGLLSTTYAYHEWRSSVHHVCVITNEGHPSTTHAYHEWKSSVQVKMEDRCGLC